MLFSARALQSNEAALWLYARVRAPPTSAAEGCEDREIWKGSWTSAGPRLRWSLVRSFGVVMCARREREAAEGGPELCVYDIKLISAPARWSPIGRCRGDYAPTVAAGDSSARVR